MVRALRNETAAQVQRHRHVDLYRMWAVSGGAGGQGAETGGEMTIPDKCVNQACPLWHPKGCYSGHDRSRTCECQNDAHEKPDNKGGSMRLMDPQPEWEEDPELGTSGEWCGRYRHWDGDPRNPEVNVSVDVHCAPADMPGAEPKEVKRKWYWVMPNAEHDTRRTERNTP